MAEDKIAKFCVSIIGGSLSLSSRLGVVAAYLDQSPYALPMGGIPVFILTVYSQVTTAGAGPSFAIFTLDSIVVLMSMVS
jgi:hypothetical protein